MSHGARVQMELMQVMAVAMCVPMKIKSIDAPLGTIAIDSIYTPIVNVRFVVEPTRVGQKTDYERLCLVMMKPMVPLTPEEAVTIAGRILHRSHQSCSSTLA